ncbi:hypothetical protein LTS08_008221 [Lithohypha guttulata]|nr:hypothetical protein LTS08_008221 [Lithohypha guttulata]
MGTRIWAHSQSAQIRVLVLLSVILLIGLWMRSDGLSRFHHVRSVQTHSGHPVARLVEANQAHLTKLHSEQSRTLKDARNEYQRRYHRQPPLGFDTWFRLAREHDFVLIDEFDTFMESLEPFFGVPPNVLQHRLQAAFELEPDRFGMIKFEDGSVNMSEGVTGLFKRLMPHREWAEYIPYNVTLLVNDWDEPMVSVPFPEVTKAKEAAQKSGMGWPKDSSATSYSPFDFSFIETGKQNGWAATSQACSIESPSRQLSCSLPSVEDPLNFVTDVKSSRDVCQNCDLLATHGLLVSPGNMHIAHSLTPIWSASKPSHFNDILYPSAYYVGARDNYDSDFDNAWEEKESNFYWTGSSTGGWATSRTWNHMQRQRMVLKTNNLSEPIQLLKEVSNREWQPYLTTMDEVADHFSTRITNIVQCTDEACQTQKEIFGIPEEHHDDPQEAAYRHKFVLDIDGNGFSGRFYRLLQSRSVVVKQTIFSEWHDDRLIPWVHYVPLSTLYAELPELARFLATTEEGLRISERIARESTDWHDKALRDIDLQLVWLRMILEFGRLMNPEMHT